MSEKCISCGSCGMPMIKASDFSGGDVTHKLCSWCGDASDHLKVTFEEVVKECAGEFVANQGMDETAAKKMAIRYISSLPAWKGKANAGSSAE